MIQKKKIWQIMVRMFVLHQKVIQALPVEYQVSTLIEASENIKKTNHDYAKELYQMGYGLGLERSEKDYLYLSHITPNTYNPNSIFRAITSLPIDPFNSTNAEIIKNESKTWSQVH